MFWAPACIVLNIKICYVCFRKSPGGAEERHAGRAKTKIIVADFTSSGSAVPLSDTYNAVRRGLAGLDVRLLVNNAGVCYARPERLLELAPCCTGTLPDPCRDVIECNALATVAMCRIVMPLMVDGGRNGGAVINVSSVSALLPSPLLSVYAATKVHNIMIQVHKNITI